MSKNSHLNNFNESRISKQLSIKFNIPIEGRFVDAEQTFNAITMVFKVYINNNTYYCTIISEYIVKNIEITFDLFKKSLENLIINTTDYEHYYSFFVNQVIKQVSFITRKFANSAHKNTIDEIKPFIINDINENGKISIYLSKIQDLFFIDNKFIHPESRDTIIENIKLNGFFKNHQKN